MRPIGPGIRTRRKRWFLVVAGSRTGHPLQGEVPGGMTLVAFTCRGRPAALNRATLRRHGSLWDGSSLGKQFPPGCSTPACACFAFRNRGAIVSHPRCSPAPGLWDVPGELAGRAPAHASSQPALWESSRLRKERGSADIGHFPSTAASIWKSARGRAGTRRAAAVVRADVMAGTTADHEAATLLLHDVGNRGAANRILFLNRVLGADPVGTTFRSPLHSLEPVLSLLVMKGYRSSLLTSFFPFSIPPFRSPDLSDLCLHSSDLS